MSPVDDPILQNREECSASGGDLGYFPLALSFQDGFMTNVRIYYRSRSRPTWLAGKSCHSTVPSVSAS